MQDFLFQKKQHFIYFEKFFNISETFLKQLVLNILYLCQIRFGNFAVCNLHCSVLNTGWYNDAFFIIVIFYSYTDISIHSEKVTFSTDT